MSKYGPLKKATRNNLSNGRSGLSQTNLLGMFRYKNVSHHKTRFKASCCANKAH